MFKEVRDAERALAIDQDCLDIELIRHPSYYAEVSRNHALAVSKRDQAKLELDRERAETAEHLRNGFIDAGEKITEAKLSNLVASRHEVVTAQEKVIALSEEANLWAGLKEAWSKRTYMLRELAQLWLGSYFVETSSQGPKKDNGDDIVTEGIRKKQAGKRKRLVKRKP
jgi:hypothetical protein